MKNVLLSSILHPYCRIDLIFVPAADFDLVD